MTEILLMFAVCALGVTGLAILKHKQVSRRTRTLWEWARRNNLHFQTDGGFEIITRVLEFPCLQRGSVSGNDVVINGSWQGRALTFFDYRYDEGSGSTRRTNRFSAVVLESPFPLEPLLIRRENVDDRVNDLFGFDDDIDFESARFSRQFHVRASHRKWAHDVITREMMDFLMFAPSCSLRFGTNHVMAWSNHLMDPLEIQAAIRLIFGVLERIPNDVVEARTAQV